RDRVLSYTVEGRAFREPALFCRRPERSRGGSRRVQPGGRPGSLPASYITEVTPGVPGWAQLQCKIAAGTPFGDVMKRIVTLMLLLVALSAAWSIPAHAQRISPQENARQSKKAIKKQQKMLNKVNKKQAKAMKKAAKKQRKQMKTANRRHKK